MKKAEYFRDGDLSFLLARMVVDDNGATAESWDYKKRAWVPDGHAWDIIDDDWKNASFGSEEPVAYIELMLKRDPKLANFGIKADAEGAFRKASRTEGVD